MDIFKIQNVDLVRSVEALGSLKKNQHRMRIFPLEINTGVRGKFGRRARFRWKNEEFFLKDGFFMS
jgi:hypothetical protein